MLSIYNFGFRPIKNANAIINASYTTLTHYIRSNFESIHDGTFHGRNIQIYISNYVRLYIRFDFQSNYIN